MNIEIEFKKIWGKELFYPVSEDAIFITKLTGRPTLTKSQIRLCLEAGWNVSVKENKKKIQDYL